MLTQREKSRIINFFARTLTLQIVSSREKTVGLCKNDMQSSCNLPQQSCSKKKVVVVEPL